MTVSSLANSYSMKNFELTKHIMDNHVEIDDDSLMKRFEKSDSGTKLYSKFDSVDSAKDSIVETLTKNKKRIENWDNSEKLQLKLIFNLHNVIGYGLNKNGNKYDLSWITVILCKNKNKGFRIKTAYPS